MDLTTKKRLSCRRTTPPLSGSKFNSYLKHISSDWQVTLKQKLTRQFTFNNFLKAVDFINQVARLAQKQDHHPDIHLVNYKKVIIDLTTHAINGLSENDFILAAKIDHLVSPKPSPNTKKYPQN